MQRILFPDVTLLAVDVIADDFAGHSVFADVVPWMPFDEPTLVNPPVVTVVRLGGTSRQHVFEDVDIAVDAWAHTHEQAHDLCQAACSALRAAKGTVVAGIPIYLVADVTGPANTPDPDSGLPRYTATLTLTVRGSTATSS